MMKKYRKRVIYLLFGLLALPVLIGIAAATYVQTTSESALSNAYTIPKETQAARWGSYQSPFYYPFKTRGTYLQAVHPFIHENGYLTLRNSNGFRTPEYTIAHPPNTFRVLVMGDGFTTARCLPIQQTYPYVLARLMNEQCPSFQSEVIALSMARRLEDSFITFVVHGQTLKPDLVIFQISTVSLDFLDYMSIMDFQGMSAAERYARYGQMQLKIWNPGSTDWNVFVEVLDFLQAWSKENTVPVMFLIAPPIDTSYNGRNFNHYDPQRLSNLKPFHRVIEEIRNRGFVVQDLVDSMRDQAGDHYLAISPTVGEPNEYFFKLVARTLLRTLNENGFFSSVRSRLRRADDSWQAERILRKDAADNWLKFNTSYVRQLHLYERLRDLYPKDPWTIVELAETYFGQKRWKDASQQYEMLTDLHIPYVIPNFNVARRSASQEAQLLKIIQVVPDHTPSIFALAVLYKRMNRIEDSCKMYGRVMEVPQYEQQYLQAKTEFEKMRCKSIPANAK